MWHHFVKNNLKIIWHGNITRNDNYIVVEDIHDNLQIMPDRSKVNKYFRDIKKKNADITLLDSLTREYISALHIVQIKNDTQIIFYQNLHSNPHYSVSGYAKIQKLMQYAKIFNIETIYYNKEIDHEDYRNGKYIVLNNTKIKKDLEKMVPLGKLSDLINNAKIGKKRNILSYSIGFSGQVANGWNKYKVINLKNGTKKWSTLRDFQTTYQIVVKIMWGIF